MLKHIRVTNFKSLENVSVSLDPVTVLIGRSGSGKSNFVQALRWLRDYLIFREDRPVHQRHGGWDQVMSATARFPAVVSFTLTFSAPGFADDFCYHLQFEQEKQQQGAPRFSEERLSLGGKLLFHQRLGKWVQQPALVTPPQAGPLMLGALTGVQEVTLAYLVLTNGIGCYAFPDRVLTAPNPGQPRPGDVGFADDGDNFLQTFEGINVNLSTWQHLRDMAASMRRLKPSLRAIDLQQPGRGQIAVSHEAGGRLLVFNLGQESEGFRRLLACLLALYQTPPKQTLIFDEPEKGIYPAGLVILAEEFKGHASKGRGQVLLTTHSPDFLDQFAPEQIRVVEMRGHATHIGPVAPEQMEALREHFIKPGDLLTADEARLPEPLAEVG